MVAERLGQRASTPTGTAFMAAIVLSPGSSPSDVPNDESWGFAAVPIWVVYLLQAGRILAGHLYSRSW